MGLSGHLPDCIYNAPADMAIKQNFWTVHIREFDKLIDRLQSKGDMMAESNYMDHANKIREAKRLVCEVRDAMLIENYDANRKGTVVKR